MQTARSGERTHGVSRCCSGHRRAAGRHARLARRAAARAGAVPDGPARSGAPPGRHAERERYPWSSRSPTMERRTLEGPLPTGVVRFRLGAERIEAEPAGRVLWLPVARELPPVEDARFADAERLEFQGRPKARCRRIARPRGHRRPRPGWRAASIGTDPAAAAAMDRCAGRVSESGGHRQLAIAGAPAICRRAARSARSWPKPAGRRNWRARLPALEADLLAGRWTLDRPAWELTAAEIERWSGHPLPALADRRLFSAAADLLWAERAQTRHRVVSSSSSTRR
jgi:hypothetical protein